MSTRTALVFTGAADLPDLRPSPFPITNIAQDPTITDEELHQANIIRDQFQGERNYTIKPNPV
jgi:hypothetical protein